VKNLFKRLAILALATVWVMGVESASAHAAGRGSANLDTPPATPPKHSSTVKSTRTTAAHRSRRRSRLAADPWHLSSYGNPAVDDNPAGDDPLVRQAALDALGNLSGSIVVVDPNTGRILSIVNQKLALSSGFTPCSTFKPIVALAALREGLITPNTRLYVGERTRMNLTDALAHSNNPFFLKLGEMLGFKRITEYAQEFGLGEKAGIDVPGESAGVYPSGPPKQGGVGFLAYCGTDVEITTLQMAAVISTIANGGTLYALQYPRTPEELAAFQPVVRRRLDDLADYIPQIRDGLAGSVLYGTGRSAYDPDLSIFGKTGTCSENGARLGWFMSYAGEPQSKYVAVVLLRGGRMMYGPHAAEVAGRFYRDLMQKEHPTQASRVDSSTLASQR
jgi:cell division protein FtsI/penicillin-binding protein 2